MDQKSVIFGYRGNCKPRGIAIKHRLALIVFVLLLAACNGHNPQPPATAKIALHSSEGVYGYWDMLGFRAGSQVPDFTLYTSEGRPFQLYRELKKEKPTVLINASYTCDYSRASLPSIKKIAQRYKSKVNVVMIYTIDAHPSDTLSPYARDTSEWIRPNNIRDNIYASQPKTYGDRVALSNKWIEDNELSMAVLIDGPNNEYWRTFGQAPNMCYIIDPEGVVRYRETWYDGEKLNDEIQKLTQ